MTIQGFLQQNFSEKARHRGMRYYRDGLVEIIAVTGETVESVVYGDEPYDVGITLSQQRISSRCTCPASRGAGPCKHVYATLMQAIDEGLIRGGDGSQLVVPGLTRSRTATSKRSRAAWEVALDNLRQTACNDAYEPPRPYLWPAERRVIYVIELAASNHNPQSIVVEVLTQKPGRSGGWVEPTSLRMPVEQWLAHPDPRHRMIAAQLVGAGLLYDVYKRYATEQYELAPSVFDTTLRAMCETGNCFVRARIEHTQLAPLRWDADRAWQLKLRLSADESGQYQLRGGFARDDQFVPLSQPLLVHRTGLFFCDGAVGRYEPAESFVLLSGLRGIDRISVPRHQVEQFLSNYYALPKALPLELPIELGVEQVAAQPRPVLRLRARSQGYGRDKLRANLSFDYGERIVPDDDPQTTYFDPALKRLLTRDRNSERAHLNRLFEIGFKHEMGWSDNAGDLIVAASKLANAVAALTAQGWRVEADGKLYRQATDFKIEVTSGIDWFDLKASVDFGGVTVSLPTLLAAVRKGETTVVLDDGSLGMLPEEWLGKYDMLAGLGDAHGDALRFKPTQTALLDALLAAEPSARFDETFASARNRLRAFEKINPADPIGDFQGALRPYQREGLGWLKFLQDFSFGGCLADDMGLGKTIQVLALLEQRRQQNAGPTLVVVPRSLVFNWKQEAARFTPQLRILDHTGLSRQKSVDHFSNYDLVLTTYGTLRRDAALLKDFSFDYVVLDEAQAIKNAATASSKAARLLKARHRLALSGTPIENHLGELWSLLEFLNPGMLGSSGVFRGLAKSNSNGNGQGRSLLAQAIRPFVLRRTKNQVATDLPEKTEQTIYCELEPEQRKLYNELRDFYRDSLLERIKAEGINKAKIVVLEALLRLRQAACHPGLIDKKKTMLSSAKTETLMQQLTEVLEEGHKALVFSQFTSLLAIVRARLDAESIPYEYLDGQTTDRQRCVDHFQTDPDCRLFLISLKAGGVGLNLTAAEYVFLLDPWWNPAVEAQAIDRTHRIGQTRNVFAYRLIAKDTVEEKVLELQGRKRELADAIIGQDSNLIGQLTADDLRVLLS